MFIVIYCNIVGELSVQINYFYLSIHFISVKLNALLCAQGGGGGVWSKKFYSQIEQFQPIEKKLLTDRKVPTLFKQIQRKYFFDREIEFVSIRSVKVLFPTFMILKKDSGDEHKFCTTLMGKTVGGIEIINSDLFSDQFFLQWADLWFYK